MNSKRREIMKIKMDFMDFNFISQRVVKIIIVAVVIAVLNIETYLREIIKV